MKARQGWCPGALRPMRTGDGWLVRIRPRGGALSGAQARAIAELAARHGNGQIDLTQRANLQIRGVAEASLADVAEALGALGLLDASPAAEAVRNVLLSPLAGLDPAAAFDVRPAAAALEARLAADAALHALPGKFGFSFDDGGALSLAECSADIRFEAIAGPDGPAFAISLDGAAAPRAICAPQDAAEAGAALARQFLRLSGGEARRMREVADRFPAAHAPCLPQPTRTKTSPAAFIGSSEIAGAPLIGLGAAFGRCSARQLAALCEWAGEGGVRLTPWRIVFAPGLHPRALAPLAKAGWITDPDDSRLAIAACPGAPACASAETPASLDAAWLAAAAPKGAGLHVSGCAKGCAQPGPARFTLVGRTGRYDVVENGAASGAPALLGVSLADLPDALAARMNPRFAGASA